MEIMQMLQVIPQSIPTTVGTAPEVPAGSAATPDLFASLMAGLLIQPVATTATAELPSLPAETAAPNDQHTPAAESDDNATATAEAALMSLASLVAPQTIVQLAAPVTETPVPTGTTSEASAAIAVTATTTATLPATATVTATAPATATATAPATLPLQPTQAEAVIPHPELPRETTQAKTPPTEAAPAAPAPQAAAQPAPVNNPAEVLTVTLEPPKTAEVTQVKPQAPPSEPLPETAPAPEVAAADRPAPRTMGPAAAYPDRIPVIPRGEPSPVAAERVPMTETARQTETAPLAGVKPQEVEVVIKGEAGDQQSFGEQGNGGNQAADMKAHVAPVQSDAAKPFEPTLATATKPEHQPTHGLRDSIMAQVKEGIATREPAGNGEISIRLAPAELGELRINVRVVDQHVKVEVLAANSQVREILLSNLDSLKENFSRQNLTMTGFDVSTGTGQGYEQLFREGREAGHQGGFRTSHQRGTAEDEAPATQAADYYYTDRRDSILDVRL
ncbi:flagellar hook-length control protein FliK [Geobacter sp.]|uniref:flagellar hook-length control protein FliK n=1 Tax=Geobacter sp. TaxID=46610 RepID=UPI0027B8A7C5|nr:flagellar hook-length control protein FliK [Geobacter sp.]